MSFSFLTWPSQRPAGLCGCILSNIDNVQQRQDFQCQLRYNRKLQRIHATMYSLFLSMAVLYLVSVLYNTEMMITAVEIGYFYAIMVVD